jgi:N-acetylglucosaminyldiphosphoundecaprenol N-acetyl-beta-D-mannosaminyltransferase
MGRVCGLDLMPALVDAGRPSGARHYLYGGAPGVPERLAARLRERFPGVQIVGVASPPFRPLSKAERDETIARINAARPDFVWVGLGTPKQDLWLADYRDDLDAAALLAVGAAFEIVSGVRRRAPLWMQRASLEWLFRLILEPRRLWRRYAVANVRFIWLLAREDLPRLKRRRLRLPR